MIKGLINKVLKSGFFVTMCIFTTNAGEVNKNVKSQKVDEEIKEMVDKLSLFDSNYYASKRLPKLYRALLIKVDSKPEKLLCNEIRNYIKLNNYIEKKSGELLQKAREEISTSEGNKKAFLLSVLFNMENLHLLPEIYKHRKDSDQVYKVKVGAEFLLGDYLGAMGSGTYETTGFYTKKTVGDLVNDYIKFWLRPTAHKKNSFEKFYSARKDLAHFTTQFYVRLARANILKTGKPDKAKIRHIKEDIEKMSILDKALLYASVTSSNSEKRKLLISTEKLIELFRKIPLKTLEEIIISNKSVTVDPDLTPARGEIYKNLVHFLLINKEAFWKESEFSHFFKKANPYALNIYHEFQKQQQNYSQSEL